MGKPVLDICIVTRCDDNACAPRRFYDCLGGLERNTVASYRVYVWCNNDYKAGGPTENTLATYISTTKNLGFQEPNNRLVQEGSAPYVVLLNDDVVVGHGWDAPLISALLHPGVGAVGYSGGLLDETGLGVGLGKGPAIDYVEGWCLALRRETIEKVWEKQGNRCIFDPRLQFAYAEDSWLCLLLKEMGYTNLALPDMGGRLIKHERSATSKELPPEEAAILARYFHENHATLRERFGEYLINDRVLANAARRAMFGLK